MNKSENRRTYYIRHRERIIEQSKDYYKRTHIQRSQMTTEEQTQAREYERLQRIARREKISEYRHKYYLNVIKPKRENSK